MRALMGQSMLALALGQYTEVCQFVEAAPPLIHTSKDLVSTLVGFQALALRRLGDRTRAQYLACDSLQSALSIKFVYHIVLLAIALLLVDDGQIELATTASALLQALPSINNAWGADIGMRELAALLPERPRDLAPATLRWQSHDIWEQGQALLSELDTLGWRDSA